MGRTKVVASLIAWLILPALGAQATLPAAVPADVMIESDRALIGGLYTDAYFYQFVIRAPGAGDSFEGVRALVRRYPSGLGGTMNALEEVILDSDALKIEHDARGFDVLMLDFVLPVMGTWHIKMESTFGGQSFTCVPIGHVEFTGPTFSSAYRYAVASVNGETARFYPCTVGGGGATGVTIFPRP